MSLRTFCALLLVSMCLTVSAVLLATPRLRGVAPAQFEWRAQGPEAPVAGLGEAALRVVARAPFRLYPSVAEVSQRLDSAAAGVTFSGPPLVRVSGILGPPWRALVEGEALGPGTHILSAGGRIGAIRVDSVTRELIWLGTSDSTWSLRLEVPWK